MRGFLFLKEPKNHFLGQKHQPLFFLFRTGLIKMDQEVIEVKELPEDVRLLQDQLRMANLKNQLLEAMLDIGKEQYGLDLRKKSGTKPS
jgi:hypothetical protein